MVTSVVHGFHPATVTAIGPVAVRLDGSDTAVAAPWHDAAYTPTVNDRVVVASYRGALLIVCKEATG
jgi:hypothetical protein